MVLTINELIKRNPDLSLESKVIMSDLWCEDIYETTGKFPASYFLVRLADWLLEDELTDKSRSKVQNNEYPILSKPQLERRYRELSMEVDLVDSLHRKRINHQPTRKKDAKHNEY